MDCHWAIGVCFSFISISTNWTIFLISRWPIAVVWTVQKEKWILWSRHVISFLFKQNFRIYSVKRSRLTFVSFHSRWIPDFLHSSCSHPNRNRANWSSTKNGKPNKWRRISSTPTADDLSVVHTKTVWRYNFCEFFGNCCWLKHFAQSVEQR